MTALHKLKQGGKVLTQTTVYLDTEGTGLDSITDTVLEISIVNDDGVAVLDSLVRPPESISAWPQAQAIHGITPEMVAGAPTLSGLAPQIREAVKDKDVIIYNAAFDTSFLGALLDGARSVQCCMEAWAEHTGEWDDYHQHWRWQRLDRAAEAVCFTWPGKKHRALADSLACRAVWQYLHCPAERERVDTLTHEKRHQALADQALRRQHNEATARQERFSHFMTRFFTVWWLRRYEDDNHWSRSCNKQKAQEEFAQIFTGKTLALLALEGQFDRHFLTTTAIPPHLKPASHFSKESWYQAELTPCAAYIGNKRGWPLYDISEKARIDALYPLRIAVPVLAEHESLVTKTALKKAGFSDKAIEQMTPVAERQNQFSGEWYPLYQTDLRQVTS